MNQPGQAICHCVISHPETAKFLAIKHGDGWSPPVALINEEQSIVEQVKTINNGLMENYGFMTAALRQLAASPGYRCIEVEMLSPRGRDGMQAIWVGKKEYADFRKTAPGDFDPMAAWLDAKEAGKMSEVRSPWAKPGWFAEARDWIQQSLKNLNIHQQGPVEQFRTFRSSSCILRVPVARGMVYFKASSNTLPSEPTFTRDLAEQWPDSIVAPLWVDEGRNWMLSWDYGDGPQARPQFSDYPQIATDLAKIQLGSLDAMDKWHADGCRSITCEVLSEFAGDLGQVSDLLTAGGGPMALTEPEIQTLEASADYFQPVIGDLSGSVIPDTLVHPDLWYTNIYRKPDGFTIADWSDTAISHPFFSLMKLIRFRELSGASVNEPGVQLPGDEALVEAIIEAYLSHFNSYGSADELRETMTDVIKLEGLWRLYFWHQLLAREEHLSVTYQVVVRHMQRIARGLCEQINA